MVELDRGRMGLLVVRFLARPKDSFVAGLQASNSDFVPILTESIVYAKAFGHRTRKIDRDEYPGILKRLHLAQLLEFSGNEEFDSLVGQLTVSAACFDEFWELIPIDAEYSVDDALQELPEELRDKVNGG